MGILSLFLFLSTFSFVEPNLFFPSPHLLFDGLPSSPKRPAAALETSYKGKFELFSENSGVCAMHLVITPNNKAVIYDTSIFGPSKVRLPEGNCRIDPSSPTQAEDCWAHAVMFDYNTANIRPLKVVTDTWCSSGSLAADGTLVQSGGWKNGGRAVRYLRACDSCDWKEYPTALAVQRWYATQQILADGSFIVVGGRRQHNYEYIPPPGKSNPTTSIFPFPLLAETNEKMENNLYPFVYLLPDGNLFIFANNRSVLLNPTTNKVIREFPQLKGGSRNYPASAASTLLPIDLSRHRITVEVLICGGAGHENAALATRKIFIPALATCGRLAITAPNPKWRMEIMPMPRVMGDALILPNAEILIINGAANGSAGWHWARSPVHEPLLYRPKLPRSQRFRILASSTIARMYHSSCAVLPDGSILVAGSNPNPGYNYTGVEFPTEMRVEKFYPPYLDPNLALHRPRIEAESTVEMMTYGQSFRFQFGAADLLLQREDIRVTMYAPAFTTHAVSMNQRMLILKIEDMGFAGIGRWQVIVTAPPSAALAPAGYYMLFVVNRGVPSEGVWVQIRR